MTAAVKLKPLRAVEEKPSHESAAIKNGVVTGIASDHIMVDVAGERIKAKKAFSCLVEPVQQDKVICSGEESGQLYVLGILERTEEKHVQIHFPGNADLVSSDGAINIRSKTSLSLMSKNMDLFSKKITHKSCKAFVAYDELAAAGSVFEASFKSVKLVSQMINTMAQQVIQRFRGYMRNTEANDQVRAGQMNRRTDGMYTMDSKYTVMVSSKDSKIDGERIHMG